MPSEDSTLDAFGDFVRAQRRLARISQRRLASLTGVSDSYLSQVERGMYRPSAKVAKALAEAFGLAPQTLYARLGLLDQEADHVADVEQAIKGDLALGADQKDALLLMYRMLAAQSAQHEAD